VPDCYTGNYLISPGWSNTTTAAADNKMGIAQLSNHMLIPPDGLTFQDNPHGELFGYSWMSLPLADVKKGLPPTGNQHIGNIKRKNCESKDTLSIINYYTTNAYRMEYQRYKNIGAGIIGSGAIESAHRTVVQKRMKQSGQRWSNKGAQNMLNLRVLSMNKQWDKVVALIKKAA
jgi:hypothetical protein